MVLPWDQTERMGLWLECIFSARSKAESTSFISETNVSWGWHLAKQSLGRI